MPATLVDDEETGETSMTLVKGDTDDILFEVLGSGVAVDLSKAVDGTASRPAIARFAVKLDPNFPNSEAQVFKASHDATEIAFLTQSGATVGHLKVFLDKPDTEEADEYEAWRWDLEVSRQDAVRTGVSGVGTVAFSADSNVVTGSGTAFTGAKVGDILHPTSGANSGKPALIQKVVSTTELQVSWDGWAAESGITFELRRGQHTTVKRGDFILLSGIVAQ